MALTDVEISNRALIRLGASTISSLSDTTDRAIVCNQVYTSLLEAELALTPWRFAMKKALLARLATAPVNEWKYAYQLPSDRIGAPFAMFHNASVGSNPVKQYEVFADQVFTNEEVLYADYPFKPTEPDFPAYFTEFLVLAICGNIAYAITDQANLAQHFREMAYGLPSENGAGGALARARFADAAQQPPQVIEDWTLLDVRNG